MRIDKEKIPRALILKRIGPNSIGAPENFPILELLDQSCLPDEVKYLHITDWREVIDAIKALKVRGAPVIGIAGAAAVALRAAEFCYANENAPRDSFDFDSVFVIDEKDLDPDLFLMGMSYSANMIASARPTAVNLQSAVSACMQIVEEELKCGSDPYVIADKLYEFVKQMIVDDEDRNREMGRLGASLLSNDSTVMTHCNAGSLATAAFGTALGVIYTAAKEGKIKMVYVDETRPVLQGARLTAWELSQAGIPNTLICDDASALVMSQNPIDAIFVGADRIAGNGDVANKIGTLALAISANYFGVDFYVVAPTTTIDFSIKSGKDIPIEVRIGEEVMMNPPSNTSIYNPAFDVVPAKLITKIITEKGIFTPSKISSID